MDVTIKEYMEMGSEDADMNSEDLISCLEKALAMDFI